MPGCNKNLSELYKNALNEMEMEGGFTEDDIVSGRRVLANGAVAGYVMVDGKRKWRIVAGADASYMAEIRGAPRGNKPITQRQALMAFNKAYKNRPGTSRGRRQAKSYDRNHSAERGPVVADSRYLRSPWKYDYQGIDTGPKTRKARSAKQKANDGKLAKRSAPLSRTQTLPLAGGAVDLKQAVKLLRSYYDNKYN